MRHSNMVIKKIVISKKKKVSGKSNLSLSLSLSLALKRHFSLVSHIVWMFVSWISLIEEVERTFLTRFLSSQEYRHF